MPPIPLVAAPPFGGTTETVIPLRWSIWRVRASTEEIPLNTTDRNPLQACTSTVMRLESDIWSRITIFHPISSSALLTHFGICATRKKKWNEENSIMHLCLSLPSKSAPLTSGPDSVTCSRVWQQLSASNLLPVTVAAQVDGGRRDRKGHKKTYEQTVIAHTWRKRNLCVVVFGKCID